jgi:hypothetical protein
MLATPSFMKKGQLPSLAFNSHSGSTRGVKGRQVSEMTIGQCRATWRHWRRPSTRSAQDRDL